MRKLILGGIGAVVILIAISGILNAEDMSWEDIGRGNLDIKCILVSQIGQGMLFAGYPGGVLKSGDAGKNWRIALKLSSRSYRVNLLAADPQDRNIIYAATDVGLYRSKNLGGHWERLFKGRNKDESQCLCVVALPYAVLLGTKSGLFVSRDKGRSWHKQDGIIGNLPVLSIDFDARENGHLYLAGSRGVFGSIDSGDSWERLFAGQAGESEDEPAADSDEEEAREVYSGIHFAKAGPVSRGVVYLATAKGVYKSSDSGKSWEGLTEYGLLDREVLMLCVSKESEVYALTVSGIFIYKDKRWHELSFNLPAGRLNYLAVDDRGILYATGEKGIFKSGIERHETVPRSLPDEYIKGEPGILELQQAAIRYAEVAPEKIARWRKKAAIKAILPQVRLAADRNSTDFWHWEGGSSTKCDDDTLRRGKDTIDWDVSLTWDLSDLIWNESQTSIDVRSRLMVELRDDILDQVNKFYFERLRVKMELDSLGIEDRKKRFEKELKLRELAASLDALTAGYYSERLHQLSRV